MKVTGYQLREAIKKNNLKVDMLQNEFMEARTGFEDDDKRSLRDISDEWFATENRICILQELTNRYNLEVKGTIPHFGTMTLARIIKLIGPVSRLEKRWRDLAAPKKDRWGEYSHGIPDPAIREEGKKYAQKRYSRELAEKSAVQWAEHLLHLRGGLATLNATAIELDVPEGVL